MVAQAFLLTIFVVTGNTVLRRLVNRINRIPFNERTSEATYELLVTSDPAFVGSVRKSVVEHLDRIRCPAREIVIKELADDVQVIAILTHMSINPDELNAAVDHIKRLPGVRQAAWEMRATG